MVLAIIVLMVTDTATIIAAQGEAVHLREILMELEILELETLILVQEILQAQEIPILHQEIALQDLTITQHREVHHQLARQVVIAHQEAQVALMVVEDHLEVVAVALVVEEVEEDNIYLSS